MRLIDADALEKRFEYLETVGNNLVHKVTEEEKGMRIAYRLAKYETHVAPTIDQKSLQPKWIPVAEKMPENEGDFIVTANDSITGLFVFKDHCYKGKDGEMHFLNQIDGNLYHNHDSELERHTRDITAWMPVPEPYKEDEHD